MPEAARNRIRRQEHHADLRNILFEATRGAVARYSAASNSAAFQEQPSATRVAHSSCVPEVPTDKGRQLRSEEHTSELQSLMRISYAVFCLKKKKNNKRDT